jgi:hypothetical protein
VRQNRGRRAATARRPVVSSFLSARVGGRSTLVVGDLGRFHSGRHRCVIRQKGGETDAQPAARSARAHEFRRRTGIGLFPARSQEPSLVLRK